MEISGKEYWSGLLFPAPGDLPDPGMETKSPVFPALQVDSLPTEVSFQERKASAQDHEFSKKHPIFSSLLLMKAMSRRQARGRLSDKIN